MRLNELLHSRVVAADGTGLGQVKDVRLVRDGPPNAPGGQASLRVDSLIVGHGLTGRLLGYGHSPVDRPWLLRVLVRWLDRERQVIEWSDVAEYRDGVVTLDR